MNNLSYLQCSRGIHVLQCAYHFLGYRKRKSEVQVENASKAMDYSGKSFLSILCLSTLCKASERQEEGNSSISTSMLTPAVIAGKNTSKHTPVGSFIQT